MFPGHQWELVDPVMFHECLTTLPNFTLRYKYFVNASAYAITKKRLEAAQCRAQHRWLSRSHARTECRNDTCQPYRRRCGRLTASLARCSTRPFHSVQRCTSACVPALCLRHPIWLAELPRRWKRQRNAGRNFCVSQYVTTSVFRAACCRRHGSAANMG